MSTFQSKAIPTPDQPTIETLKAELDELKVKHESLKEDLDNVKVDIDAVKVKTKNLL